MLFGFVSLCALASFVPTVNGATSSTLSCRFGPMHRVQREETCRAAFLKRSLKLLHSCWFTVRVTHVAKRARPPACRHRRHRRGVLLKTRDQAMSDLVPFEHSTRLTLINFKHPFELDSSGGGASGLIVLTHRQDESQSDKKSVERKRVRGNQSTPTPHVYPLEAIGTTVTSLSQFKWRIYHSLLSQNTEILKMLLLCAHVGPAAVMWWCNTWCRTSASDRFRFFSFRPRTGVKSTCTLFSLHTDARTHRLVIRITTPRE